ncbi:MAG TPA: hypothetical protein VE621_12215 [Bryobacteraceae bacterium]|nr:hypothetical protein [Bryobacteraceae bacterium]
MKHPDKDECPQGLLGSENRFGRLCQGRHPYIRTDGAPCRGEDRPKSRRLSAAPAKNPTVFRPPAIDNAISVSGSAVNGRISTAMKSAAAREYGLNRVFFSEQQIHIVVEGDRCLEEIRSTDENQG